MTKRVEPTEDTGAELMLAFCRGAEEAFEELVHRFRKPVLLALYRYVGQREAAEDLCQEVFLRVYGARKRYEPRAKFTTWLFRIVQNLAINHQDYHARRRAVSIHRVSDEEDGDMAIIDPNDPSPSHSLERDELGDAVKQAVLELSPNQRMATIYSKYHGLSYEEIAEIMEMRVEAIKSLLFRAREKMRVRLIPLVGQEVEE